MTLAMRGNDTTDIWNPRGESYLISPSRPFQSVNLSAVRKYCDLVLYSLTFNNDIEADVRSLQAFKEFRIEAQALDMRYFLEVFNPNVPRSLVETDCGSFVNDSIIRALAGVTEADSTLVVGLLGGSSGTTLDTFELLAQGEAAGD